MNYGWTIVSKSDMVCGGPPAVMPITCKRHLLKVRAAGGIVCLTREEMLLAESFFDNKLLTPARKTFGREAYFKCRLNKHWLYKPTRSEKTYFDHQAIEQIMDI